jgi:hypothetical protein
MDWVGMVKVMRRANGGVMPARHHHAGCQIEAANRDGI